jgi:thioesterase domain-containing protein
MASHYLEEIRRVQPQGPYLLGGYCFGGIIAFEIAHQLGKSAEAVDLVVMLDPDDFETPEFACRTPKSSSTSRAQGPFSTERLRHHANNLKRLSFRGAMDYLSVRVRGMIERGGFRTAVNFVKTTVCKLYFTSGYPLPPSLYSHYMLGVYDSAFKRYIPEPYPGRVIVWKAASDADDVSAWKTLGTDVEVARVQCKHAELLGHPYIQVWARHLADELKHGRVGKMLSHATVFMCILTST